MADQGRDAQRRCRQPDAARSPRDPGWHLHRLSARRFLGCMGRRLGLHPAEFSDRRGARRALRAFWRTVLDDRSLLLREPRCHRLMLDSCYRLAKLGMEDWLQWVVAAACRVVTVWL